MLRISLVALGQGRLARPWTFITTRFGVLSVQPQDEIVFENGLIGLEDCKRWVVLTDSNNAALGWLQNLEQGHIALGVVSPSRFVPDYQLRVDRADLRSWGPARFVTRKSW